MRARLPDVLLSLVHNAIEAMASVEMSGRAIVLRTKLGSGNVIVMETGNSGSGIAPEDAECF